MDYKEVTCRRKWAYTLRVCSRNFFILNINIQQEILKWPDIKCVHIYILGAHARNFYILPSYATWIIKRLLMLIPFCNLQILQVIIFKKDSCWHNPFFAICPWSWKKNVKMIQVKMSPFWKLCYLTNSVSIVTRKMYNEYIL